jgi:hypothetical protein
VQDENTGGDKAWDAESTRKEFDRDIAARRRTSETTKGIQIGIAVVIIIVAAFVTFSFIDFSSHWTEGKPVYPPVINCVVLNGISNWTLFIANVGGHYELGSVKATILDEQIPAQSLLSEVPLSTLTQDNWTTHHVRYVKVNGETVVTVGASIIIDKVAYPRAHEVRLIYQSKVVSQDYL